MPVHVFDRLPPSATSAIGRMIAKLSNVLPLPPPHHIAPCPAALCITDSFTEHSRTALLQGPTISSVYNMEGEGKAAQHGFYAATICVKKKKMFAAVKTLQKVIN